MKRLFFFMLFATAITLMVRQMAGEATPTFREACDRMEARMPDWFPIKRMAIDIEALKEQNARILERLDAVEDPPA